MDDSGGSGPSDWTGRGAAVLAGVVIDLRHGLRVLVRRPAFSGTVIGTLGLGIGVCAGMFSVLDGVVFRPLPYEGSERLVQVWETYPSWRDRPGLDGTWDRIGLAWPDFEHWRESQRSYDEVAVYDQIAMTITGRGSAARIGVGLASTSLLPLLVTGPTAGRFFLPGEDGPGASKVAVVSHAFSRARWGTDADAIGSAIALDGDPFVVVGILPPDMRFAPSQGEPPAVWIPVGATSYPLTDGNHFLTGLGRLRPGIAVETAVSETEFLLRAGRSAEELGARLVPLYDVVVGEARPPLLLLMGAAILVFLVACANVASLLAGESARREREVATRAALGARGSRIARQFVIEALVLCALAVGGGLVVAHGLTAGLVLLAPPELPRLDEVAIDTHVLLVASGLGAFVALAFGLGRTAATLIAPPGILLKRGGRYAARGRWRSHTPILGAQVVLAMLVLASGSMLARSLLHVESQAPGFSTENLVTAVIELPPSRYADPLEITQFFERVLEQLRSQSSIVAVGGISTAPFTGGTEITSVRPEGLTDEAPSANAERRVVLPGTLSALGVPVLGGGLGAPSGGVPSVVVSETLARRFWPDGAVLGRTISLRNRPYVVTGIAGDLRDNDLRAVSEGVYYVLHTDARDGPPLRMHLLVRTAGRAGPASVLLNSVINDLDPELPVSDFATMDALVARSLEGERYRTVVVNIFAVLALILVAVGIFGVTLRLVQARRREIAVRGALGATPRELVMHALAPILPGLTAGILVGLAVAQAGAPILSQYMDGVSPRDLLSHGLSVALLLAAALTAAWLPARQVARSDLVTVLTAD